MIISSIPNFLLLLAVGVPALSQEQHTPTAPPNATTVQIDNTRSTSTPDEIQVPKANPSRPTFTNPAQIPPVGYLQFEQGIVQANTSPGLGHQFAINQTTKLAVHSRLMFEIVSQPFTSSNTTAGPTHDTGDLDAGLQTVLHLESGLVPTISLAYNRRLRSGTAPNLDIGSFSQSATFFVGGDFGKTHYDLNAIFNEQTDSTPAAPTLRRAQYGQTLAITQPIFPELTNQKLALIGEVWHYTQPLPTTDIRNRPVAHANAVGTLFALAYTLYPNLVFDAAFDHGYTSTSTQWQAIAGVSYLLPHRLWKQHTQAPPPPPHDRDGTPAPQ